MTYTEFHKYYSVNVKVEFDVDTVCILIDTFKVIILRNVTFAMDNEKLLPTIMFYFMENSRIRGKSVAAKKTM